MNSLQIQYFLTVTEQKSFTEAARILFITQPAISKQIRLLEQELGAVLFERGKKTVCLTFAGQAFYDYFTQCNFQLELLQKHLEQKKKSGRTPLRFSYLEGLDPVQLHNHHGSGGTGRRSFHLQPLVPSVYASCLRQHDPSGQPDTLSCIQKPRVP